MPPGAPERVASLDLIRGVAVLGILAINIAGFSGPSAGVANPHLPEPGTFADEIAFGVKFLFFEGKMRALFTILFGASLVLFTERAEERGDFGDLLQLRRLFWLALFGLAHFYLLWWGDILFLYAVCGVIALMMRELSLRTLTVTALGIFTIWHFMGTALDAATVIAEQAVLDDAATIAQVDDYDVFEAAVAANVEEETAISKGGFLDHARNQFLEQTLEPFTGVISSIGETLPLMLLGMVLLQSGFFAGAWKRSRMVALGIWGTLGGLALTALVLAWAWLHNFPTRAMESAFFYWLAIPHLLMALGYAALLVLATPRLSLTLVGRRLTAAGRTAFSNYIGTSLVMTGIFYGWGLGLFGTAGHAAQWLYVLLGWTLMLAWSEPWLRQFRRGPLEWLWRSATEWRLLRFKI